MPTFRRGWERRLAVAGTGRDGTGREGKGGGRGVEERRSRSPGRSGLSRPTSGVSRLPLIDPSPRNRAPFLSPSGRRARKILVNDPGADAGPPIRRASGGGHRTPPGRATSARRPFSRVFFFIPRPASPFPLIVGREGDRSSHRVMFCENDHFENLYM